ncbi:hypothetical protein [Paenibacillus polymyxa]|uniref:hypothetical protein n=1 Tax=Paenibacillus polymyxa TaxID=1406 RepID=UPI002379274A|nr:hypothetical protein [Paenibacillus polymyxa]WDM22296.1 hypothetical protein J4I02_01080 [Paenibacillus polymyxa]
MTFILLFLFTDAGYATATINQQNAETKNNRDTLQNPVNEINHSVELLQRELEQLQKNQIDKKEIYDVLLQTKDDKIGLLQGNISSILTWGGIVLALMTVAFTFWSIWLNRLFSKKIDAINTKHEEIQQFSLDIKKNREEVENIQKLIMQDEQKLQGYLGRLEGLDIESKALQFELRYIQVKYNIEITKLKYKNVIQEIQHIVNKIAAFNVQDLRVSELLNSNEYESYYIAEVIPKHQLNCLKWLKYNITENEFMELDEENEEWPDDEVESELHGAEFIKEQLEKLLEKLMLLS